MPNPTLGRRAARFLAAAAITICTPAAIVGSVAPPAAATVVHGAERIDLGSPYAVKERAPGVPGPDQGTITGSGFTPGSQLYLQVCDGTDPYTQGWSPGRHCAYANSPSAVAANGTVSIDTGLTSFQFEGPFHGQDPDRRYFNCLAPGDDPHAAFTVVGHQPIDPYLPAWGSRRGGDRYGGGSAPCQLRISSSQVALAPGDLFIPLTGLDGHAGAGGGQRPASGGSGRGAGVGAGAGAAAVAAVAAGAGLLWRRRRTTDRVGVA